MALYKLASASRRILANLVDLSITAVFYNLLLSFSFGQDTEKYLLELCEPLESLMPAFIQSSFPFGKILFFYLLHFVLKLVLTIVIGKSLGQMSLFIRSDNAFVANRVLGSIRVIFEMLMSPFIVFDLPILRGMKTLKETLSFTKLETKFNKPSLVSLIILPIVFFIFLAAPLFNNLTLLDGLRVDFKTQDPIKLKNASSFGEFKYYSSNYFKFSTFSSLADGRYILIPSFEIYKIKSKKKISPFLRIYDTQKKIYGQLRIHSKFDLLKVMNLAREDNPLFIFNYKEISNELALNKDYSLIDYKKAEQMQDGFFNDAIKKEVAHLIKTSFEIRPLGLLDHVLNNGPFLGGYVRVRSHLLNHLANGALPNLVDIVKLGKNDFLRFHYEENEQIESLSIKEFFFPLSSPKSLIIEYAWPSHPSSASSKEQFRKNFFGSINWYFDFKNIFSIPENMDFYDPMIIMDFYLNDTVDPKKRDLLEDYIYQYLFAISKKSVTIVDEKLSTLIISSVSKFITLAKWKNSVKNDYYSLNFIRKMQRLSNALERNDLTYFGE